MAQAYSNTPNLSKIKLGNVNYYLKDSELREIVNSLPRFEDIDKTKAVIVNVDSVSMTSDITSQEIITAINNGQMAYVSLSIVEEGNDIAYSNVYVPYYLHIDDTVIFTATDAGVFLGEPAMLGILIQGTTVTTNGIALATQDMIPDALPNPRALTFTGGATGSYDGSSSTTINIPTYSLSSFGITATKDELNYTDGVTSNIQTQLNAKVPTSRTINGKKLTANISLAASDVGADTSGTAASAVSTHNSSTTAHSDIRTSISDLATKLNNFLDVDDTTTDQLSELIALINDNKDDIESITSGKVNVTDIVNNLTTNSTSKVLSAAQGVAIKTLIDNLQTAVNGKASTSSVTTVSNNLADHIVDKENPHEVTKAQLGLGNVENKSSATIRGELTKANVTTALGYTPPTQDTTYSAATTSAAGLMSTSDKSKLDGIATGAEVNQNAFSSVVVGSTTIAADSKTDSLTLVAGSNITLTPDATNDKITIAAKDTTYTLGSFGVTATATELNYTDGVTSNIQTQLDAKALDADLDAHTGNTSNPHGVTKSQVGLGNVENKSSATIRGELTKDNVTTALGYTPPTTDTTYSAATTSAAGLMSAADKSKLDGIASGATANTGTITGVSANGTSVATSGVADIPAASTSKYGVTKLSSSTSSTSTSLAATASAVKAAYDLAASKASTDVATTTANGLMSSTDKSKLDGIAAGATANTGTITGVSINNTSIATSGVANIPVASTSAYGAAKLSSSTSSTSETLAATPKAVKAAYDLAASKAGTAAATSTTAGLMSAADKAKLDGIASGATANTGDITGVTAGSGLTGGATSGTATLNVGAGTGISVTDDAVSAKLRSTTALTNDSSAATETSGRVYPVAVDKSGYLAVNVPWTNTTSFTVGATATDDDVVVLTGTNGTNSVTFDAKHAKKGPSSTYTSGNTKTSISGSGDKGTIKIPQITVDTYGHVTAAADEDVTITMPTIPTTLKNPKALTVGSKTYDGSTAVSITAADLGLASAMKFLGTSSSPITDGSTANIIAIEGTPITVTAGNVVLYGSKEFVWNGSAWEELGGEGSYKVVQEAVSSPSASGNATAFIDTISQDANGKITATKKNIPTALKNPNAITFTGAVSDSYDGSSAKTINIPTVPTALKNPNAITFTGGATGSYDGSEAKTVNLPKIYNGSVTGSLRTSGAKAEDSEYTMGQNAFAEGSNTKASGNFGAHAEGSGTTASGNYSHAEGNDTIASGDYQHVQGKYNIDDPDSKYAHIVGNGKYSSKGNVLSNAHTIDWNGLGWFKGGLKVGGTGQDDTSAVSVATLNDIPSTATTSAAGLMSAADKAKLDGIASGATANTGDITGVTAGSGLTGGGTSGSVTLNIGAGTGISVSADAIAAKLRSTTALTNDSAAATETSGRVYPVAVDKSGYLAVNVPWTNTTSFTITATATDDDVVVLTGTNGSNKVTFDAKHAKKGPSSGYTSGNTKTSIDGSNGTGATGTIKIPQITVDAYGHVTAAADEDITIKIPSVPTTLKNPNAITFTGGVTGTYDGSSAKTVDLPKIYNGSVDGSIRTSGAATENSTYTMGTNAFAEGSSTKAIGENSHAEGESTTASGSHAHAEGSMTTASKYASHAEGSGSNATGDTSHAEGISTTASGFASHAEGEVTVASGYISHAEGSNTTASQDCAHAEGYHTTASSFYQHVQGKYNIDDSANKYAHIVGNGSASALSNAHTVDWNGLGWFKGGLKVGGTGQDDTSAKTVATLSDIPSAATTSKAGLMSAADKTKLDGIATGANAYSLPTASSSTLGGVKIGSNISISSGKISVPTASGTTAGVTIVYPAASCTSFSSDSGTVTPLAVQKGAKQFAITRPSASTNKAITRYSNTTGDVQDSKIIIEDVTNSKDSSKKAQVIAIPAEGNKKMVYGYCTDQVDGTSFIGGVFDQSATSYPYNQGLAIGGTSGNLLWKGAKVATVNDLPTVSLSALGVTATAAELNKMDGVTATTAELNYVDGVTSNIQTQLNNKAPKYIYSTNDLIAGESVLATGTLYLVYENSGDVIE